MKKVKVMDVYFRTSGAYTTRNETLHGADYLAVPVTMMVEGVHSGSHGAILHTAEELGKIVETWDNIPVTIGHPVVDENYVSANSPAVLTEWSCGTVFYSRMDGNELKAEAWINIEDITEMNPALLQRINDGEVIEVSVGVFSDEQHTAGTYQGENYVAIAHNHRPDHLALLPDEVGACSIEDGCGIRVNKSVMSKEKFILNEENKLGVLKQVNKHGFIINETGFSELRGKAYSTLDAKDGNGFTYYLEEMFDNHLIYRERNYTTNTNKLFKQSYQENAAGEVELTGEAVQVKRDVSYNPVPIVNEEDTGTPKRKRTKFNNNKGGQEMPKDCQVCKDKATALIANTTNPFTEANREMLEGMTVEQLTLLEPTVVEKEIPGVVTNAQIMSAFQESVKTPEDFLKFIPEGMREQFKSGLDLQTNAKNQMVTAIIANTKDVWTKEDLEAMPIASVTKVYKSVVSGGNEGDDVNVFLGAGGGIQTNEEDVNDEVPVMAPIGVEFKAN